MLTLENKVGVVTGAASGLGEAAAKKLAEYGAAVVVADIDDENAQRVAKEISAAGGTAIANHTDISTESDIIMMAASLD